jgi:hypothetical protein
MCSTLLQLAVHSACLVLLLFCLPRRLIGRSFVSTQFSVGALLLAVSSTVLSTQPQPVAFYGFTVSRPS